MGSPRIAVVVKRFPKLSETFILEELLALERRGLDLDLYALHRPTDDRINDGVADLRAPVRYAPRSVRALIDCHLRLAGRRPWPYLTILLAVVVLGRGDRSAFWPAGWLAHQAGRTGVEHLHVHFLSEPASVVELAARLTGLPFSASAHAKDIYLTDPQALRRKLTAARFTVTCTGHNAANLRAVAPGATVDCVHHGIDLDRFEPGPEPAGRPVLLGVGRLRPKKGFDVLLRAVAALADQGRDVECRLVGYGPEEPSLRALADELGITDRVRLLGKRTRAEVIDQYRAATVVVQPCRITDDGDRDGIPNVLLEAMAMERPVVTTAVSGIPEAVVDGVNGLLVEPDDPPATAAAVAALLDDADLRRRLGRAGRDMVWRRFTVDRSAEQIASRLQPPRIAYVVKGFPRLSELFIATEIHRLERLGTPLRLFVIKQPDEEVRHAVVSDLRTVPEHLPPLASISRRPVPGWLRESLPAYRGPVLRVAAASPVRFGRTAAAALAQAWRARKGRWPRKVYLKEFLQAVAIADRLATTPSVRHLHGHFAHGATTVTWWAASLSGRTFSFTAHAKDIYLTDLNPADLLARKLRSAQLVATCTEANRRHLLAIEPAAPVVTVYHGLNQEFAALVAAGPPPRPAPGADDPYIVVAVGRQVAKKGLDLLVDACAILVEAGVPVELRLIGEPGDQSPGPPGAGRDPRAGSPCSLPRPDGPAAALRAAGRGRRLLPAVPGDRRWRPGRHPQCADGGHGRRGARCQHPDLRHPRAGRRPPQRAAGDTGERAGGGQGAPRAVRRPGAEPVAGCGRPADGGRAVRRLAVGRGPPDAPAGRGRDRGRRVMAPHRPRDVFCVIDDQYRSVDRAVEVAGGRFDLAGQAVQLGLPPDWLGGPFPDDDEWRIELSKFYHGLDLAHAHGRTGDRRFAAAWIALVESWIDQVPVDHDPTDVVARRIQNWTYAWSRFTRAGGDAILTDAQSTAVLASIADQAAHLRANLAAERNHRTLELYALVVTALAHPPIDRSGELAREALFELYRNLRADVLADGVHRERSTHYHAVALRSYLGARVNAHRFGLTLPSGYDDRLGVACEFLAAVLRPDGSLPMLSDADDGDHRGLLASPPTCWTGTISAGWPPAAGPDAPRPGATTRSPMGATTCCAAAGVTASGPSPTSSTWCSTAARSARAGTGSTTPSTSRCRPAGGPCWSTPAATPTTRTATSTGAAGSRARGPTTRSASTGWTRCPIAGARRRARPCRPGSSAATPPPA